MSAAIKERMGAALKTARDISELAEREGRDLTPEENEKATAALLDYKAAKKDFERTQSTEALKSALSEIGVDLGLEPAGQKATPDAFRQPSKLKSIGQMFAESAEYKSMMGQFADGRINEKARVQSAPMGVKALVTGASDTSGGAFVNTDIQNILEMLGRRELTVRDLISVRQTESDTVEYVRQTTQLSSAAPVPEATSAAAPTAPGTAGALVLNAGGGYKPEGSMAFEKVTATVKTIAEWVPATKRGLADASQLRGLIDDELRADLAEEEEDQILNGSGSGENLTGILQTSGIQTQAWTDDLLTTIRKAKTKTRTVGRVAANGIVLNPEDAERLDLLRPTGGDGQFYGPGPFAGAGVHTVWGLPIVESEAIAAGTGLVGDYTKAVLWDREQASITATDSHADFFIRNLVAILGEERVAFGVTRPKAFVSVDLTA
ncbi:phage major capsid protein [Microbacterium sp. MYb72]|uniref:phage major capsid protein n=1 Tax=Microbacterium sp. MYb72 TaxID=1848693 RepID=UPI000CFDE363|nr:phage major capsid protein [Microbacterium sp. MYb72]PRB08610.1 phage major capsid protein [Microbacterium sp. MYb72]